MTMCNVQGVARSDEPTENYQPTLLFTSALQSALVALSLLFWFYDPNFTVSVKKNYYYSTCLALNSRVSN